MADTDDGFTIADLPAAGPDYTAVASPLKFYLLDILDGSDGLTYTELAERSGIPKFAVSKYMAQYQSQYLVRLDDTTWPGTYHLTERGSDRLRYFRRQS